MCQFKSAILYRRPDGNVDFLVHPKSDSHHTIAERSNLLSRIYADYGEINKENDVTAYLEILPHRLVLDGPVEKGDYEYKTGFYGSRDTEIKQPWVHEFVKSKLKVMWRYRQILEPIRQRQLIKEQLEQDLRALRYKQQEANRIARKKALMDMYPFERTMRDRMKLKKYKVDPKEYYRKKTQRALRINFDREWKRQSVLRALRRAPRIRRWAMKKVFLEVVKNMRYLYSHGKFIQFKQPKNSRDYNFQHVWNTMMKTGYYNDQYSWYSHRFDLVTTLYPGDRVCRKGLNYLQENQVDYLMEGQG